MLSSKILPWRSLFIVKRSWISFIERIDKMYDSIEPMKINQDMESILSPLTINIYKTLYEANSKVELLNKELLISMKAQVDGEKSASILPPDMLQ